MNDLKGGVGLARAGGHHQQDAPLALGHTLNGAVHSNPLVIAWLVASLLVVVGHRDGRLGLRIGYALALAVSCPELVRRRELVHLETALRTGEEVVLEEAVTIGAVSEGYVERLSVAHSLLHARANSVVGVLRLNNGDRQVRCV